MIRTWLKHKIFEFAINNVFDKWIESIHQTDIVYGHQLNEKYYNLMVKEFYNMAHIFTIGDTSVVNVINMQLISKDNSNLSIERENSFPLGEEMRAKKVQFKYSKK